LPEEEKETLRRQDAKRRKRADEERELERHSQVLDPDPRARRALERKLVIKRIAKHGRVTKAVKLMRTERSMTFKSDMFATSVKKLTHVINQIRGKTVEEALVQLRFSKKLIALDVLKSLQMARDQAIVARGMGLGTGVSPAKAARALKSLPEDSDSAIEPYIADGSKMRRRNGEKVVVELKDGREKVVTDPTEVYIDQAWVNKGAQTHSAEFRARGRVNMLTHRSAGE